MSPRPAKRSPCGRPSRRVEPHSFKWGASGPRPLEDGADPFGIGEDIELFDPHPNLRDARVGKTNGADPLGETLAQIDMSRARDFADAGDNFLVINDASAILSGEGIRSREVDRNANALSAPTLIRAYSDAGHHDEPAHGDRVAGLHSAFRTAGGRRAALGHASTMPSRGECCNALLRPPREACYSEGDPLLL